MGNHYFDSFNYSFRGVKEKSFSKYDTLNVTISTNKQKTKTGVAN